MVINMKIKKGDDKVLHRGYSWGYTSGFSCFGFILILIGILWLARDMGWIPDIPLWPVFLIIIGICFMAGRSCCRKV